MSRGMVSFLAGMGTGYIKARDKAYEQERQAKQDAWMEEQRNRQRQDWQEADKLKADLKDAAATRDTVAGTETKAGDTRVFSQSAENAAAMQKLLDNEAELTGAAPVQQASTAVTGKMARGHQIGATAEGMNTPDARNQRVVDALMNNGQIERAGTMETNLLDQKAKRLGLQAAELKFADEQFNRALGEKFANSPDWTTAAAQVLTETQQGGLAGVNVTAVPGKDGKTVDFVGQGADGQTRVLATFENSDAGKAQFMQRVMRAPVETKIGWIVEDAQRRQTQANADRDFDLRKRESESQMQYRDRMLAIQQAQESRARATHAATMEDNKIPPAVKLNAQALADQIKSVDNALNKAMAEGMFDPNNPGAQKLIEQRAALSIQYRNLLNPYIPGGKGQADDPLGLSGGGAPAAGAGKQAAGGSTAEAPTAAPAQKSTPKAPAYQPPTMQQIQEQTRKNREALANFQKDPDVQRLRHAHAAALRSGDAVRANEIQAGINQIRSTRYGIN